jgi:hypothetical protein
VRGALHAIGLALPVKRITINLAPADLIKEGSHFDLPIALALLAAMGVLQVPGGPQRPAAQAWFLKCQDSLPVSTMSNDWSAGRSSEAVILPSPRSSALAEGEFVAHED